MSNPITRFLRRISGPLDAESIEIHGVENISGVNTTDVPGDKTLPAPAAGLLESIAGLTARDTCEKCGGFFKLESLKPVQRIDLPVDSQGNQRLPHFRTVLFCKSCHPAATVILILRDCDGNEADEHHFNLEEGYFHSLDTISGEDQYFVSLEEYEHTFCTNCSKLIEETKCQKCRPKATTTKGGKAS